MKTTMSIIAASVFTVSTASAGCLGSNCPHVMPNNAARMLQDYQRRQEWNAHNNTQPQYQAPVVQPPGFIQSNQSVFDIILGIGAAARAQEEHELRMKIMRERLRQEKAQQVHVASAESIDASLRRFNQVLAANGAAVGKIDADSTEKARWLSQFPASENKATCEAVVKLANETRDDNFIVPLHACIKLGHLVYQ